MPYGWLIVRNTYKPLTVEQWESAVWSFKTKGTPLSDSAIRLLWYLSRQMKPDLTVQISQRRIATALGVSKRTIQRYIDQSCEVGLLDYVAHGQKGRAAAVYVATVPPAPLPVACQIPC